MFYVCLNNTLFSPLAFFLVFAAEVEFFPTMAANSASRSGSSTFLLTSIMSSGLKSRNNPIYGKRQTFTPTPAAVSPSNTTRTQYTCERTFRRVLTAWKAERRANPTLIVLIIIMKWDHTRLFGSSSSLAFGSCRTFIFSGKHLKVPQIHLTLWLRSRTGCKSANTTGKPTLGYHYP